MSEELYREICTQKQFGRLTPLQGTNLTTVFGQSGLASLGLQEKDLEHARLFVEYNKLHVKLTGETPPVMHEAYLSSGQELVQKLQMFTQNLTRLCETYSPTTLAALIQHSLSEVEACTNIETFSTVVLSWNRKCRSSTQLGSDFEKAIIVFENARNMHAFETLERLSAACFNNAHTKELSETCLRATALLQPTNLQFQLTNSSVLHRFGTFARLLLQCEPEAILPNLCSHQRSREDDNLLFCCERLFSFVISESHTGNELENLYLLLSTFSFTDNCIAPCEIVAATVVSKALCVLSEVLFGAALALTFCVDQELAGKVATEIISVADHAAAVGEFFGCPLPLVFEELCCVLDSLRDTKEHQSLWSCEDMLRPWLPSNFTPTLCNGYRSRFGTFQRPQVLSDYTASDRQMYYKWAGAQEMPSEAILCNLKKAIDAQDSCILDITRRRLELLCKNDQTRRYSATPNRQPTLATPHYILHGIEDEWDDCWSSSEV